MLREMPVVVNLREKDIRRADLLDDLRIDRYSLNKALSKQPGLYAWWSSLYASVEERREYLEQKLERLEARLASKFAKEKTQYKIKGLITLDPDFRKLQEKLRLCKASERFLKGAVRAFDHRLEVLRSLAANTRNGKHEEG